MSAYASMPSSSGRNSRTCRPTRPTWNKYAPEKSMNTMMSTSSWMPKWTLGGGGGGERGHFQRGCAGRIQYMRGAFSTHATQMMGRYQSAEGSGSKSATPLITKSASMRAMIAITRPL